MLKSDMQKHDLTLTPASIVDSWHAKCSCGWQRARSFYDIQNKEELLKALQNDFDVHVAGGETPHQS